ncbi:MAG: glycosyltransferase [Pseudomonadota bacterium]
MKIVVVVSEFPKLTETFVYREALEYSKRGHDVRIFHIKRFRKHEITHGFMRGLIDRAFTYGYASPPALAALIAEIATAPRRVFRTLRRIAAAYAREPRRGLAVLAYLPKALALGRYCRREGVDHIHAGFAGHPGTAAMIAAGGSGVPFSLSAHAHDIFVSQALLAEKSRDAAFVRTISRRNIEFLEGLEEFPSDKLRLVRCGVPRAALTEAAPDASRSGPFRILYVGSLIKRKGVRHLIDALSLLPSELDWRARIVGAGSLRKALEAQARRLGLGDRVSFEGPKPAEAAASAFHEAHAVVVPSILGDAGRTEGIPVVAMEAMALGVPVIASALSGIPELVEDGVTGRLVDPGDAQAIARALQDIHADRPAAVEMAARGRARIAAEYIVEDNAAVLADLIERAA